MVPEPGVTFLGIMDLNVGEFELLRSVGQGFVEFKPFAGLRSEED